MLTPWLDVPAAAASLRWAAEVTGLDLIRLGTTADADEVRDTAVAQPLLTAAALACAGALELQPSDVDVVAGHSVGELSAAALAGVFSTEAALVLARVRGAAMAAACQQRPTGMTAVLGGDPDELDAALARFGLTAANRNGAGQVVVAGPTEALEAFAADPPARARLRPLAVAGAFHTSAMEPARERLSEVVAGLVARDPQPLLLSNADGTVVRSGSELVSRLVAQVTAPVRWDRCQETMRELGVTTLIELAPGGTLAGLAKRTLPGVTVLPIRSPDDLAAAREALAARGGREPQPATVDVSEPTRSAERVEVGR